MITALHFLILLLFTTVPTTQEPPKLCRGGRVTSTYDLMDCDVIDGDLKVDFDPSEGDRKLENTTIKEIKGCLVIINTNLERIDFITEETKLQKDCKKEFGSTMQTEIQGNKKLKIPVDVYIALRQKVGSSVELHAMDEAGHSYDPSEKFYRKYGIRCKATEIFPLGNKTDCEEIVGDLVLENLQDQPLNKSFHDLKEVFGRIIIRNTELKEIKFSYGLNVNFDGKGPALQITGNMQLKEVDVPHFSSNSKNSRLVVIVNNGNYRMPEKNFHDLAFNFKEEPGFQKRLMISQNLPSNLQRKEVKRRPSSKLWNTAVAPVCGVILVGVVIGWFMVVMKPRKG